VFYIYFIIFSMILVIKYYKYLIMIHTRETKLSRIFCYFTSIDHPNAHHSPNYKMNISDNWNEVGLPQANAESDSTPILLARSVSANASTMRSRSRRERLRQAQAIVSIILLIVKCGMCQGIDV